MLPCHREPTNVSDRYAVAILYALNIYLTGLNIKSALYFVFNASMKIKSQQKTAIRYSCRQSV